jgi:hypothetical protein
MLAEHRRHRARACPGYSELWAGDARQKMFAAAVAYGEAVPSGIRAQVLFLTVTGPGVAEGLTWDEEVCEHLGPHRHTGPLGCRVERAPADHWNKLAPAFGRELHRQCSQTARRHTGHPLRLIERVWELQRRGVLHIHLVLGYSTLGERLVADAYHDQLVKRSHRHGFGNVDRKKEVLEPARAAAYLSSYFVAGRSGKMTLRESVTTGSMPRSIIYVRPELSQLSGITMRSLRLKRYAWQLNRLHVESKLYLSELLTVDDIWQGLQRGKLLPEIVTASFVRF